MEGNLVISLEIRFLNKIQISVASVNSSIIHINPVNEKNNFIPYRCLQTKTAVNFYDGFVL